MQKTTKQLRFYAGKNAQGEPTLTSDHEMLARGNVRYIGYTKGTGPDGFGFVPSTTTPSTVNTNPLYDADYRKAAKAGEIVPADQETADWCGVKFVSSVSEQPVKTEADYLHNVEVAVKAAEAHLEK